ncbi:uncharacterized protein [Drosophila tropicalis]|uniref:uncharacterized protein n=1 Tax=Drosophila tropicalis TaxID=46794 RepID=UPI0035AC1168
MAKLYVMFLVILAFAMLALAGPTPPPAPTLVPRILTDGFQLEPLNDKYFLSIRNPDGTVRQETVQEIAPGQLQVNGVLNQPFDDLGSHLVITYEAGPNGYVAKYSYGTGKPTPPPVPPLFLSPGALKTATG